MFSARRSASTPRRPAAGFTLIELMVGVVIGLLATLAVTHVLVNSEGQKRTTTSGSDAQVNGALALHTLQRTIQSAGYGFAATPSIIGCPLTARYGAAAVEMPATLAPVFITRGASGAPDAVRVFSSGKKTFSVPLRIVVPGYAVGDPLFPLSAVRGIEVGDLLVAARSAGVACEMFRVTSIVSGTQVGRADEGWNAANYPANAYPDGSFALNMGAPLDVTYSIEGSSLRANSLNIASDGEPSYSGAVELFPNIVNLRALYGKDNDSNGTIDSWDNVTPTSNAQWLRVVAVRLALVSRSAQYEKEEITTEDLKWDVGSGVPVPDASACGTSKCLTLVVSDPDPAKVEWKHYRYRIFDTVIPLRNMLWNS